MVYTLSRKAEEDIIAIFLDGAGQFGLQQAERVIRTLKEQLLWVRSFASVEELRLALLEWAELYNEQWLIERHGHRTPAQARRDFEAVTTKLAA